MLPLSDARWKTFYAGGDDPGHVPKVLEKLLNNPNDLTPLDQAAWMFHSDEITWSASFAAAPYFVAAARRAQPLAQIQYVCFLGALAMYRVPADDMDPTMLYPSDLENEFNAAIMAAHEMALTIFPQASQEEDVRSLLASLAAFKAFPGLGRGIKDLAHDRRCDPPVVDIPF